MMAVANPAQPAFWTRNVARARFFDAISLLLPMGEQFVIETIEQAVAEGSPGTGQPIDVQALIGEERSHQRAHDSYNARLESLGLPVGRLCREVSALIDPMRRRPLAQRLLLAAAMEQCTALLSREVLRNPGWLGEEQNPTVRMWRWHCEEELAHHGTVLTLAARVRQAWWDWPLTLLVVAIWLAMDIRRLQWALLASDRSNGRIRPGARRRDGLRFAAAITPSTVCLLAGGFAALLRPLSRALHIPAAREHPVQ